MGQFSKIRCSVDQSDGPGGPSRPQRQLQRQLQPQRAPYAADHEHLARTVRTRQAARDEAEQRRMDASVRASMREAYERGHPAGLCGRATDVDITMYFHRTCPDSDSTGDVEQSVNRSNSVRVVSEDSNRCQPCNLPPLV